MVIFRGMRDKLSKYIAIDSEIIVKMSMDGTAAYDFCCFGVDKAGKLSDDRYMIFYNQTASPNREIVLQSAGGSSEFHISLAKLPPEIDKLVFTASIDGAGTMGEIRKHSLAISQKGSEAVSMELQGSDFKSEKAIISIEIYRKDEWRIAAVANGFNGGLSALLKAFGGTEENEAAPVPQGPPQQPAPPAPAPAAPAGEEQLARRIMGKINLSKDRVNLEKHVANLSKCVVDLSKKSGIDLGAVCAKVIVVLDYSGSMRRLYSNGTVQRTINRLVPLGLTFDDNGSIDVYLFQNDCRKTADLTLSNYESYVENVIQTSGYKMGGTCYAPVLRTIIEGDSRRPGGLFGFGKKLRRSLTAVIRRSFSSSQMEQTPTKRKPTVL